MEILRVLYKIFLMPYFERDKYFDDIMDDTFIYIDKNIVNLTSPTTQNK